MSDSVSAPAPAPPQPPDDIAADPTALAEWHRILAAIEAAGAGAGRTLKSADRSILATYCRTWCVNQTCYQHVREHGPIVKWPNGLPGQSPQYKAFLATATLLRGLLADLGATPASRARSFDPPALAAAAAAGADALEF